VGFAIGVLLFAVGAILVWATDSNVIGIELRTIGLILILVGGVGAALALIFPSTRGDVSQPSRR
jgi:hypothetical protein